MGLPQISIEFKSTGVSAIQRGERGVVALQVSDSGFATGQTYTLYGVSDVPTGASAETIKQVELVFTGGQKPPKKVFLYNEVTTATDHTASMSAFETLKFDYVAFADLIAGQETSIVTWVKKMRDNVERKIKAVLPNTSADYEGVINFTATDIKVGEVVYTTQQYCSRIAGLLAGTPLQISATYQVLAEVDDVKRFTKDELDTKINAGEFVLLHDGEKVKVGRAVNSLVSTTQDKGTDWQKIKIVDILDLVFTDIKATAEDNYIGKYANSYDNKVLLINAINGYLLQLILDGILDENSVNSVGINLAQQEAYLQSIGVDTSGMNEQEIKEANTKDKVFLGGAVKPLDAIEDIDLDLAV